MINYTDYLIEEYLKLFESQSEDQLYFLSDKNLNNQTLQPRIPNNYLTKNGYEDNTIKRICFAPSIENCLTALSSNIDEKEFYVHIPIGDYETYIPTLKEVPDRNITKEIWIEEPVKVKCIGKILAIDNSKEGITYKYGKDKEATLYTWDYEWIEKY